MRNLFVLFLGVCLSVLCINFVSALPSSQDLNVALETEGVPAVGEEMPEVEPKVTCDVVGSAWGNRLCALHCISKGFRGGWCDSRKVCNCRR